MNKIIRIKWLKDYLLELTFSDGETKTLNFISLIGPGISAPLLDNDYFKRVTIDEGGGIEWPNGMDFCPNFLKEFEPATGEPKDAHLEPHRV